MNAPTSHPTQSTQSRGHSHELTSCSARRRCHPDGNLPGSSPPPCSRDSFEYLGSWKKTMSKKACWFFAFFSRKGLKDLFFCFSFPKTALKDLLFVFGLLTIGFLEKGSWSKKAGTSNTRGLLKGCLKQNFGPYDS